jgi:TonB family protein
MTIATFSNQSLRTLLATTVAASATALAIIAVPAPAAAKTIDAAPATSSAWQAAVEKQIDANLKMPVGVLGRQDHAIAQVRVWFNADGEARTISLAQTSGDDAADDEALRTARAVRYPLLPTAVRGRERSILMQIYFADGSSPTHRQDATNLKLAAHRSTEQMRAQTVAREQ